MASETGATPLVRAGRLRARNYIDTHKALVIPVALALTAAYDEWGNGLLWIYVGLHGTYTICWLMKSRFFPDPAWEEFLPAAQGAGLFATLALFYTVPWLIVSGNAGTPEAWYVGMCVAMTAFGIFWHFTSDMQKTMNLQLRPGVLITDGLWGIVRNPNYFGELLIYLGFTLLAAHWAPPLVLLALVAAIWIPRMKAKDRSLARYPEFAAYRQRTKLFIPYVW